MYQAAKVEVEKCTGCRLCILVCPDANVITLTEQKVVVVNDDRCKGCGLCVTACTRKALSITAV